MYSSHDSMDYLDVVGWDSFLLPQENREGFQKSDSDKDSQKRRRS